MNTVLEDFSNGSSGSNETIERLIATVNSTCLLALDKTIIALRNVKYSYASSASRCSNISFRMADAVHEVGLTMNLNIRMRNKLPSYNS